MDNNNIFLANAARLRALHAAIHETLKRRKENPAAWEDACRQFFSEYDKLAFPGGLTHALSRLKTDDPTVIEQAVRFLEADPCYFRSGYNKVDIIRQLCRKPISSEQKKQLQQVVLQQIRGRDSREFRAYCRLAKAVADEEFYKETSELAARSVGAVARRAQWVREHLDSERLRQSK